MNKQFDVFVKMKIKELSENISRMTYAYINPDTHEPTVVPAKHYKDILDQPVEVLIDDQVKRQFLNIMFKQMKSLKDEEPVLFYETLLLMDLNKTPDNLELNEEVALKATSKILVDQEKTQKKKFHLIDNQHLEKFESIRDDREFMASVLEPSDSPNLYKIDLNDKDPVKIAKKNKDER